MSAALLFFWDWAGAPPPPPPPPPAPSPGEPGAGGGKGKAKGHSKREYVPFAQEHWDAREAYLRSLYPEPIEPAPPPDNSVLEYEREANRLYEQRKQLLEDYNSQRASAIQALRFAADIKTMQAQGRIISDLNAKIADLTGKQAVARFMQ